MADSTHLDVDGKTSEDTNVTVTIDTRQMQSELERRQQELEIKAAELAAREEALRQGGEFRRQHNWPPLPSFCPFTPCFFQDINVDIRPEFQRTVQLGYHLWIAFVFAELLNLLAALVILPTTGKQLPFAILTLVFCVPLSYMAWFRPLYKAFKNDSSFNFMVFFFVFFIQILVVGLWAIGPSDGSATGLGTAISHKEIGIFTAAILFLTALTWVIYTGACVLYLLRVHTIYRSSGASLAKARNEFTQGVISNRYVQQTVANAARSTVNQTFMGTDANNNPGSSQPR